MRAAPCIRAARATSPSRRSSSRARSRCTARSATARSTARSADRRVAHLRAGGRREDHASAARELELIHTPGHALHHYCIVDAATRAHLLRRHLRHLVPRLRRRRPRIHLPDHDAGALRPARRSAAPWTGSCPTGRARSSSRITRRSRDLERLAREMKERVRGLCGPRRALPRRAGPRGQASPRHVCDDVDLARRARLSAGRWRSGTGCWTTTSSSIARASRSGWTGSDMNAFKAFRIHEREGKIAAGFEQMTVDALTAGDVVIRVKYSSINYKDALAATGAGKILRKYPLNGGIDLAGEVVSSTRCALQAGPAGARHRLRPFRDARRRLCRIRARRRATP